MSRTVWEGQIDNVSMRRASRKGSRPSTARIADPSNDMTPSSSPGSLKAGNVRGKATAFEEAAVALGQLWLMVRLV